MYISSNLSQVMYSAEVLVNGKPIALHNHEGKYYIQANEGTEYEIEIKNHQNQRVLAVVSVDGLDVLTGKIANDNAGGYVIDGYSNYRIKGFRHSQDAVAAFKFAKKDKSYAASKGESQNCGVIGILLYSEKVKQPEIIEKHYHHYDTYPWWPVYPVYPYTRPYSPWYIGDMPLTCGGGTTWSITNSLGESYSCSNDGSKLSGSINSLNCSVKAQNLNGPIGEKGNLGPEGCDGINHFDMGSEWGQSKESKVIDTTFEKDKLVFSLDIYYVSRQSLINMGIPLTKQGKIVLPQSFPNKFCDKPSGWKE